MLLIFSTELMITLAVDYNMFGTHVQGEYSISRLETD